MADITYNKINWENEPSHNTPLSAENLNKMDTAIYDLVTKSNSLVPNPDESPTEGLEKLEYDGTVYEVKGGHKILNDSGSILTQKDEMRFGGVYTHNASTITEVDIVREFQSVAEIEALTGEAQKGFQVVQDAEDYIPFTASENIFDNTNTSFTGDNVQDVLEEIDEIFGSTVLDFEVGQFPITYGSQSGNVTGIKIKSTGNNRYMIIGSEIAGGTLGMGTYVYNSWSNTTTRVGYKTVDVTVSANAQGVASIDSSLNNKHILSICSPTNQYICLPFSSPNASGYGWYVKIFSYYAFTPVEASNIPLKIVYVD